MVTISVTGPSVWTGIGEVSVEDGERERLESEIRERATPGDLAGSASLALRDPGAAAGRPGGMGTSSFAVPGDGSADPRARARAHVSERGPRPGARGGSSPETAAFHQRDSEFCSRSRALTATAHQASTGLDPGARPSRRSEIAKLQFTFRDCGVCLPEDQWGVGGSRILHMVYQWFSVRWGWRAGGERRP